MKNREITYHQTSLYDLFDNQRLLNKRPDSSFTDWLSNFIDDDNIIFGDLFAGGGGVTEGAFSIDGLHVAWALNHDKTAIETHALRHPETKHYQADIRRQDVSELSKVHVLWASTECTQFSKAKGGKIKDIGSYTLGWELIRYIVHCEPIYIFIENVPEFTKWAPVIVLRDKHGNPMKDTVDFSKVTYAGRFIKEFPQKISPWYSWPPALIPDDTKKGKDYHRWIKAICSLGYEHEAKILNAADYDAPTRRSRYIGIFTRKGLPIYWPNPVRDQKGRNGLPKWRACKDFIFLEDEGQSIFNRKNNKNILKQHRKAACLRTRRRFAGGVLKNSGMIKEMLQKSHFISKYYGTGINCHGINEPLHTIRCKASHVLVTVDKQHFIADHCQTDNYQNIEEPLRAQLTRQTKQLVSLKTQFISTQYNSNGKPERNNQFLTDPLNSISTNPKHQFITANFGGNGRPETQVLSIDNPLNSITTHEKFEIVTCKTGLKTNFITAQFNSSGRPETQVQSIDSPLNSITTANCFKVATLYEGETPEYLSTERMEFASLIYQVAHGDEAAQPIEVIRTISFYIKDVKARFLYKDELGPIMGFRKGYFDHLSDKKAIKLIGNAVPTLLARAVLKPNIEYLQELKERIAV